MGLYNDWVLPILNRLAMGNRRLIPVSSPRRGRSRGMRAGSGDRLWPELALLPGQDAHARAHADQIRRQFAGRKVTTGQKGKLPYMASAIIILVGVYVGYSGFAALA